MRSRIWKYGDGEGKVGIPEERKTEVRRVMEAGKPKPDRGMVNSLVWITHKEFLGWSESKSWIHLFGSDCGEPWTLAWEMSSSSSKEPLNIFEQKRVRSKYRLPPTEINTMPYLYFVQRSVDLHVLRIIVGYSTVISDSRFLQSDLQSQEKLGHQRISP